MHAPIRKSSRYFPEFLDKIRSTRFIGALSECAANHRGIHPTIVSFGAQCFHALHKVIKGGLCITGIHGELMEYPMPLGHWVR